ncbi:hypothetical protein [Cupriavidus sp. a3]|uniref:hypothetical protein n=1 Tax=Cupriavidus sp. a3 TaxID=3242158 RepID=UPI003D9C1FD9
MPQELLGPGDRSDGEYVCVRKLHTYSGEPFCYAEIYVLTLVFDALPKDTARNKKLLAALLDELGSRGQTCATTVDRNAGGFSPVRHAENPVRHTRREDVATSS